LPGLIRKQSAPYGEPTGEALLESALRHIDILDRLNFHEFKVSVKASNVQYLPSTIRQGQSPTSQYLYDKYQLQSHLDVMGYQFGFDILKSLGLRSNGINFIACPSCSRQEFNVIQVSSSGSAASEIRIVSPIPSINNPPRAIADFTVPVRFRYLKITRASF
jgi:4-hydroxy-3-methylbut-2-en-1-yl diphosphate synthase IspG/GcpE